MNSGSQRIALAAAVLAGVWVVTYWLWPAGEKNMVMSFDTAPPAPAAAESQPAPVDAALRAAGPVGGSPVEPREAAAKPAETAPPAQPPQPAADQRPAGVAPPEFTEYQVRTGDTITGIAERVYGHRKLWQAIAKANPSVDPMRLRPGQRLRVPVDPNNTQGVVTTTAPPPAPKNTEYVVGAGDTLSQIAQSVYGKATLWPIILDANRDKLKSARDLRAGMRLVIPPSPEPTPPRTGAGV